MPTEMSEEEIYHLLEKRMKLYRKRMITRFFYIHFALYSIVNIVLAIIWRVTGAGFPWFALPLGIWGVVVVFHFVSASFYKGRGQRAREWVRTMTEKEVERLKQSGMPEQKLERLRELDRLMGGES